MRRSSHEPSSLRRLLTRVEEPRGSVAAVALLSGTGLMLVSALDSAALPGMMGAAVILGGVWNGMAARLGRTERDAR